MTLNLFMCHKDLLRIVCDLNMQKKLKTVDMFFSCSFLYRNYVDCFYVSMCVQFLLHFALQRTTTQMSDCVNDCCYVIPGL